MHTVKSEWPQVQPELRGVEGLPGGGGGQRGEDRRAWGCLLVAHLPRRGSPLGSRVWSEKPRAEAQ